MLLQWKWLTPMLLRLLPLPLVSLASAGAPVHLVVGFSFGLSAPSGPTALPSSQPRLNSNGNTFIQLSSTELALPIMPLHLLGKKSWNVYNQANIDKVKRDESIAQAQEVAEEERQQDIDTARRLAILRGEPLSLHPAPSSPSTPSALALHDPSTHSNSHSGTGAGRERRKRKRAGEDDTDFEMRLASARTAQTAQTETQLVLRRPGTEDAPLTDERGHIDLFAQKGAEISRVEEAEARKVEEVAKRRREYERDYTVKFTDAAGFREGMRQPWYSKDGAVKEEDEVSGKDVWGNEDPRRREREMARVVSSDPLAAMKQGAARVRQVERERKRWAEERERETAEMEWAERERRKRRRHRDEYGGDDKLEGFSLEGEGHREHRSRHGESRRREHGRGDRSRTRDRERRHRRRD